MAGARIGYALAEPGLALAFDKVRNHFGVGRVVQAGALAALADQAHLAWVQEQSLAARLRLSSIAVAHGLRPLPSATNFVTMDCGQDGTYARQLLEALKSLGIFVRMPGVAPLDRCIRVSLGTAEALDQFENALPRALKSLT
jgi:histidinol-phosphate aminotransferase